MHAFDPRRVLQHLGWHISSLLHSSRDMCICIEGSRDLLLGHIVTKCKIGVECRSKEFELHNTGNPTVLPESAVQACLGGTHAPLNPHRQRLLAAANKPAKVKATPKGKSKAKAKPTKPVTAEPAATSTEQTAAAAAAAPGCKTESAYLTAKKAFVATLLGCKVG